MTFFFLVMWKRFYISIYVYTYLYLPKAAFTKKCRRSFQKPYSWIFFFKAGMGRDNADPSLWIPHQERKDGWKIYCINLWALCGTCPVTQGWSFAEIQVFWHVVVVNGRGKLRRAILRKPKSTRQVNGWEDAVLSSGAHSTCKFSAGSIAAKTRLYQELACLSLLPAPKHPCLHISSFPSAPPSLLQTTSHI